MGMARGKRGQRGGGWVETGKWALNGDIHNSDNNKNKEKNIKNKINDYRGEKKKKYLALFCSYCLITQVIHKGIFLVKYFT